MPAPKVPTREMSNQAKLDFIVDLLANGGPSTLYRASLQDLIDDIPRRVVKSKVKRGKDLIDLDQEIADSKSILLRMEATIAGLVATVSALATGTGMTAEELQETIKAAVDESLDSLTVTATIQAADKS